MHWQADHSDAVYKQATGRGHWALGTATKHCAVCA